MEQKQEENKKTYCYIAKLLARTKVRYSKKKWSSAL
jgi:hypothetical protein